jgi:RNA recognition motif-containing protein
MESPARGSHPPTRVLYMRNIPESVFESDIVNACSAFGLVTNILMLRDKRQGFLEFCNREEAVACLSFFNSHPLILSGTDSALGGTLSDTSGGAIEFAYSGRSSIILKDHIAASMEASAPNNILLLTVTHVFYPVTVSVIREIFVQAFSIQIEKVVLFRRGNVIQVLVQLPAVFDLTVATSIRSALDGQYIYAGCNLIKAQFSQLGSLTVKQPYDELTGWDWVAGVPDRIVIEPVLKVALGGKAEPDTICDELAALFAVYGNVKRIRIVGDKAHWGLIELEDLQQCRIAEEYLGKVRYRGKLLDAEIASKEAGRVILEKEYGRETLLYGRHKMDKFQKMYGPSMSLHLSNMASDTSEVELKELFKALGAQIRHIRFLDEQHHIAILLCASVDNAVDVLVKLHGKVVRGRKIRVGFGHHPLEQ